MRDHWHGMVAWRLKATERISPSNEGDLVGPVVEGPRDEDFFAVPSPAKDSWSI